MSDLTLIGIDPGKSGGIAWRPANDARAIQAVKMPETEADVLAVFRRITEESRDCFAYIERVASSPQMGVTSAFTFGRGYGLLRGCLFGCGIPFEEVSPAKWQGALGCRTGGDKNLTKAKAQQLFPWLKVTHAIADALLICEWGVRTQPVRT